MDKVVRIAVVGLGFMGKTHLGVYDALPNAQITAVCDKNPQNLDITTLNAGGNIDSSGGDIDLSKVTKYTNFDDLLVAGGFDAVDITLPTDFHSEYVSRALKAGYHVFVEKPLAMDVESSELLVKITEETGLVCSVGHCLRFWPLYTEVKRIIDSGDYGAVRHAEFGRYSPPPGWAADGWVGDSSRSGNASLELHIHDTDMVLFLFGPPQSVRSVGISDGKGYFSHISTLYTYPDISVTSTGGWAFSPDYPFSMRALYALEKATIEMDTRFDPPVKIYPFNGESYPLDLPPGDGYRHEIADFLLRCEIGQNSDIVSSRVSAESVRLTHCEIQSAREGREIPFS